MEMLFRGQIIQPIYGKRNEKKMVHKYSSYSGADPGFQVRGGALKQIAPSGGKREIFGVFRVKNHDITPKNHILSNCGWRRENCWDISCEKSRFYTKKNIFFPILGGARTRPLPPGSAPAYYLTFFVN
jgi:hypothetical protein